jgi:hypothetical protein
VPESAFLPLEGEVPPQAAVGGSRRKDRTAELSRSDASPSERPPRRGDDIRELPLLRPPSSALRPAIPFVLYIRRAPLPRND